MATGPARQTIDRRASQEQDDYEESFASGNCFSRCLCFPCGWTNANHAERRTLLQGDKCKESWWVDRARRIKELTEIVAGPKWKIFIRRFNNNNSSHSSKKRKSQYQYDPLTYALNFDGGHDREDDGGRVHFSVRFASSGKNGGELVFVENSRVATQT